MSGRDILAILPLIITGGAVIILMVLIALVRSHILTLTGTIISLGASLAAIFIFNQSQSRQVAQLLVVDGYARFFLVLIYCAALTASVQSYGYIGQRKNVREEYYVFLLTALLGSAVLVCSAHFASLFVGIELLSISLYILIAYAGTRQNIEAGIKYFVPAAVSIAFLLFGAALIYGSTKTMGFHGLSTPMSIGVSGSDRAAPQLFLMGVGMFLIGIFFKLAVVPFHFWVPDVFEGSPAPVTGFLATVSKGAVFAVLARYFSAVDILEHESLFYIFASVAAASMFLGNITALMQNNVKRILAYSSIAHFGYLLITVIVGGSTGLAAAVFYLTAYFIATLTAFSIITFLSSGESDLENIDDYRGLAARHPFFAAGLTVAMLSLAGIPLTAGFIAKFYVLTAGAEMKLWALLVILVVNSVIGLFYYLRVVAALYTTASAELRITKERTSFGPSFSWIGGLAFALLFLSLLYLGIWPGTIVQLILTLTNLSI
jgi:NADH-quinone oxidoreductase subunit N